MKKIVFNILHVLNPNEKSSLWRLSVADIIVNLLDISFLMGLLFLLNFYTHFRTQGGGQSIFERSFTAHPLLPLVVFFLVFTAKNIFGFYVTRLQFHFVYAVASRLSKDNLRKYLEGSFTDFVRIDSSVTNRKISQQSIEFSHYELNGIQQIFSQIVLIAITCGSIIFINPTLFFLLTCILAPPVFIISFLLKRKLQSGRTHGKETGEKADQHLQEAILGFVESHIYLKKDYFTQRYYRYQLKLNRILSERLALQSLPVRMMEIFAVFGLLLLISFNTMISHQYKIQLVTIGAFMIASYKIIPGIVKISNLVSQVKFYEFSIEGLCGVQVSYVPSMNGTPIKSIGFQDVCFSYQGKDVVCNFSMEAKRGEILGITGFSGRGKTTIINLLLGFLNTYSGEIFVNGQITTADIRKGMASRISYIKQHPFLIHASILENITLEEEDYDVEKIKKILYYSGMDKIVSSLPDGLETIISENGKNFSGGQRQRVILARALYWDFDVLILDEPFNELDAQSELEILKQLSVISKDGKIIILISHNKMAMSFCDRTIHVE